MLERGHGNAHDVAAPFLGNEVVFRQLLLYVFGVGARLIHFVYRNDDLNARSLGMVYSFDRLRHDTVVGGNDKNGNIRSHSAACAHCGERLVPRRVKEGYILALYANTVSAYMLSDAARLAGGDMGVSDSVEQRCFAVVNVTHDAHDGCALDKIVGAVLALVKEAVLNGRNDLARDLGAQLVGNESRGVKIDDLVDGRHNAHHHKALDDLSRRDLETRCKLADRDLVGYRRVYRLFLYRLLRCRSRAASAVLTAVASLRLLTSLLSAEASSALLLCAALTAL